MTYLQSLILGLVQGITEFFPISSSGHLILIPEIFGWQQQSLTFDTVLHLGTAGALIVYFFKDIRAIFVDPEKKKLGLFILIGSIPAVVFGLLLDAFIESNLRSVSFVVLFLVFALLFRLAARVFSSLLLCRLSTVRSPARLVSGALSYRGCRSSLRLLCFDIRISYRGAILGSGERIVKVLAWTTDRKS